MVRCLLFPGDLVQHVLKRFPSLEKATAPDKHVNDPEIHVKVSPEKLHSVCQHLQSETRWGFDLPLQLTAIDFLSKGYFELVYYLYSTVHRQGLVLRCRVDRLHPEVDSVSDIWPGMDFQEREIFDLMGIFFRGHPNLKRIMMWEGFPGHPLRKDYVHVLDQYDSGLEIGAPNSNSPECPASSTP